MFWSRKNAFPFQFRLTLNTKKGECAIIELNINVPEMRAFIKDIVEVPRKFFGLNLIKSRITLGANPVGTVSSNLPFFKAMKQKEYSSHMFFSSFLSIFSNLLKPPQMQLVLIYLVVLLQCAKVEVHIE